MSKKLGSYTLGPVLGQGAFSEVRYCVDSRNNKSYAIKIISIQKVMESNLENQLKREIAIMKKLKHKHIVQLREVLQSKRHIYIILELITGGELFVKIVNAKFFTENEARKYFQQLISGIQYCHSQGIAHRDLKPENLLLDDKDCLKISDFGLSNLTVNESGRQNVLKTTCGTPNYVAPEVLKEKGYTGEKADVWSCGVILFVMLAGYFPFDDLTPAGLYRKIENGIYTIPKGFSNDVKDLIKRILVVDPNNRISIDEIIKHKWFQVGYQDENKYAAKVLIDDNMIGNAISEAPIDESSSSSAAFTDDSGKDQCVIVENINAFEFVSKLLFRPMHSLMGTPAIRRNTQFIMKGSGSDVVQRLRQVLKEMNTSPVQRHKEIKCTTTINNYLVTFNVEFSPTIGGFSMVDVKRIRGGILEFNKCYRNLIEKLGKDVLFQSCDSPSPSFVQTSKTKNQ